MEEFFPSLIPAQRLTILLPLVKRKIESYHAGEPIMSFLSVIPSFINPMIFIGHHVPGTILGNGGSVANKADLFLPLLLSFWKDNSKCGLTSPRL